MSLIKPTDTFGNREVSPKAKNEQHLFLLEFFVYRVCGSRLEKLNAMFYVPTRVSVKFLDFDDEDMAVTPVDLMFEPRIGIGDYAETFNSGRSIMFAMDRSRVIDKEVNFVLRLTVEKRMPKDTRPDVIVGRGEIDMTKHFAALRKEMLQCDHTNYPPPKIFEGSVELYHEKGATGSLAIYARISGFGESIVTEIETPRKRGKSKSYVFKSSDEDKRLAYDCRPVDPKKIDVCDDSEANARETGDDREACPVCAPSRYDCTPCGMIGGAAKRTILREDESDQALKTVLDGKIFARAWHPESPPIRGKTQLPGLPIQSSRGPTEPCGRAVVLKVSGLLDVDDPDGRRRNPTVTVEPEFADRSANHEPDHDVFVLRIGKKGLVGAGEKSDIQLEMRTPKGPERRPPIRYETREMQTDDYEEERRLIAKSAGKSTTKKKKKKKKKK